MSGNPYEKVFSGKPLQIPAQAWNTLMDVAQERNGGGRGGGGIGASAYRRNALILVQNDSGADVGQFGILGIDDAGITPTNNIDSFKNEVFLSGVTPTAADYTGWFVVAVNPIADGAMGLAFANGVFPVKVNMVNAGDSWADVKDADATQLQSSPIGGAAQILWVESGTGSKWAIVRLGNAGQPTVKVKVTGTAAGGGKYVGRTVFGDSTAVATGNLAMPEGMTVASSDNVLLLNAAENGGSGHSVAVDGTVYSTGEIVGTGTDGKMIVMSRIAVSRVQSITFNTGNTHNGDNTAVLLTAPLAIPNTISITTSGTYLATARISLYGGYDAATAGNGSLAASGDVYDVTSSTSALAITEVLNWAIEKYSQAHPLGAIQITHTLTLTAGHVIGLRFKFNKNVLCTVNSLQATQGNLTLQLI